MELCDMEDERDTTPHHSKGSICALTAGHGGIGRHKVTSPPERLASPTRDLAASYGWASPTKGPASAPPRLAASHSRSGGGYSEEQVMHPPPTYLTGGTDVSSSRGSPYKSMQAAVNAERLAAMYARAMEWRRRCEDRYGLQRQQEEAAALAECTFTPGVDPVSARLLVLVSMGWSVPSYRTAGVAVGC